MNTQKITATITLTLILALALTAYQTINLQNQLNTYQTKIDELTTQLNKIKHHYSGNPFTTAIYPGQFQAENISGMHWYTWLSGTLYNRTDTLAYPEQSVSYIIFGKDVDGDGVYDIIYAKNCASGQIEFGGECNAGGVDGSNASAVIQAVANALSDGGIIRLKAGTYLISTGIMIFSPIKLVGEGMFSTCLDASTNIIDVITFSSAGTGGGVFDLRIVGKNDASSRGIVVNNTPHILISQVSIAAGECIKFTNGSHHGRVKSSRIYALKYGVIYDDDSNGGTVEACSFAGENGTWGRPIEIFVNSTSGDITIRANYFEIGDGFVGENMIYLKGDECKIENNHIGTTRTGGGIQIKLEGADKTIISGNTIMNSGNKSISFVTAISNKVEISNNYFRIVFAEPAIYADYVSVLNIEGNIFEIAASPTAVIESTANSEHVHVIGNTFYSPINRDIWSFKGKATDIFSNNKVIGLRGAYGVSIAKGNYINGRDPSVVTLGLANMGDLVEGNYIANVATAIQSTTAGARIIGNKIVGTTVDGIISGNDNQLIAFNYVSASSGNGIRIRSGDTGIILVNNDASSYSISESLSVVHGNKGFATENSGISSGLADGSYVVHGLVGTPATVTLTCLNSTYDGVPVIVSWDRARTNSTHIAVHIYWANGTVITDPVIAVSWQAKYQP